MKKVIIIGDNRMINKALITQLEILGHEVACFITHSDLSTGLQEYNKSLMKFNETAELAAKIIKEFANSKVHISQGNQKSKFIHKPQQNWKRN